MDSRRGKETSKSSVSRKLPLALHQNILQIGCLVSLLFAPADVKQSKDTHVAVPAALFKMLESLTQ